MDWKPLAGRWTGSWRTWVEPDELYSEGPITADIEPLYDGKAALLRYAASLDGDVTGVALIGSTQGGPVVTWLDTWHTSGLVMASHGSETEDGIEVTTTYQAGADEWHWTSRYAVTGDKLTILHYNAGPDVPRYLGVEAVMERAG